MMSYKLIPAQRYAAQYVQKTMNPDGRTYWIGGHSKGGNLSVYAAMMCNDAQKEAIAAVYSNDGPGLPPELLCAEAYTRIEHKIIRIVPEFSIVGMIFEKEQPQRIVKSNAMGILQHDLLTWEVTFNHIKQSDTLSPKCRMFNEILDHWLEDVAPSQREVFVRNFFDALEAGGAKTMNELTAGGIHSFESVLMAMGKSDTYAKRAFWKLIQSFICALRQIDYGKLLKEKQNVQAIGIFLLGLFFVVLPKFALQSLGTAFFLVLLFYCSFRLFHFFIQWRHGEQVEKVKFLFYGAVTGIELVCILYNKIVVLSAHWVLFFYAWMVCISADTLFRFLKSKEKAGVDRLDDRRALGQCAGHYCTGFWNGSERTTSICGGVLFNCTWYSVRLRIAIQNCDEYHSIKRIIEQPFNIIQTKLNQFPNKPLLS